MGIRGLFITLLLMSSLAVDVASGQSIVQIEGRKYAIYDVVHGDTLYSLSRKYGVAIEDIISANTDLKGGLKAGQRIKIPMKDATIPQLQEVLSSADSEITHRVIKGETLYSLSQRYGVTVEEIRLANPHIKRGLKAGQLITIPKRVDEQTPPTTDKVVDATTQSTDVASEEVGAEPSQSNDMQHQVVSFPTLDRAQRANVALLLPLGSEERPASNYLDFYRGFMLGLDSIRCAGISADVTLYNTAHDHYKIDQILASRELERANLIVGPVYEDELIPVISSLGGRNIPIVSPLANLTTVVGNNIFQMSPAPSTKYNKVKAMFDGSKRVVVISTDNVDKEFEAEVLTLLGSTPYEQHKYIYEHPSIIEKREKEREKMRAAGLEVDDTPSPSDMSPLLQDDRETVFVITANNEIEVDRILAAIASANISLTARSQRVAPFVIFGNNRWNRYRNIDRSILFANRVVMLSTYHARRSDMRIRQFDREFVEEFGCLPSLYAYRGYDTALLFISALYGGDDSVLAGGSAMPLLTPYRFVRDERGVNVNDGWITVKYNSNFTITTE